MSILREENMFILLSHKLDELTPMYGGQKGFLSITVNSIEKGDTANTSKWEFPNHLGTHIDFPYHFYSEGQTLDDYPVDFWIIDGKKVQVLEANLPNNELLISPGHISDKRYNQDAEFLIIKTGIGEYRDKKIFWEYNPGLSLEFAEWMGENFKNIRLVGLDSISVSSWQNRDVGRIVHRKMLDPEKPILLIEDMDLSCVTSNTVFRMVFVAPLLVKKTNGSPCTILAEVEKQ